MIFGGLQKQSLIDYPGKLSCVLFTSGCNFTCPYCHNPELARGQIKPTAIIKPSRIYQYLTERAGFLDAVVITGGEPTLHDDLVTICQKIRDMGYAIKLDTNGSRPEVLKTLLQTGCLDYIAMDLKTEPNAYPRRISPHDNSANILKSIGLIKTCGLPYEFRTTCVKPFVDADTIKTIALTIQGAMCYALQTFKDEKVLSPDFFKQPNDQYHRVDLESFREIAAPLVQSCIIR